MKKLFEMPDDLNEECKKMAKMKGMTLNGFIIKTIEKGLNYYKAKNQNLKEAAKRELPLDEEVSEKELEETARLLRKLFAKH